MMTARSMRRRLSSTRSSIRATLSCKDAPHSLRRLTTWGDDYHATPSLLDRSTVLTGSKWMKCSEEHVAGSPLGIDEDEVVGQRLQELLEVSRLQPGSCRIRIGSRSIRIESIVSDDPRVLNVVARDPVRSGLSGFDALRGTA